MIVSAYKHMVVVVGFMIVVVVGGCWYASVDAMRF